MTNYLLSLLTGILLPAMLCAQSDSALTITTGATYTIVEEMPLFPGGEDSLKSYLTRNLVYPETARLANVEGTVYIQFLVSRTGAVANVKVLRGVSAELDNEAVRVVRHMPAWKPGKTDGDIVQVQYNLPIRFILKDKK